MSFSSIDHGEDGLPSYLGLRFWSVFVQSLTLFWLMVNLKDILSHLGVYAKGTIYPFIFFLFTQKD